MAIPQVAQPVSIARAERKTYDISAHWLAEHCLMKQPQPAAGELPWREEKGKDQELKESYINNLIETAFLTHTPP